MDSSSLVAFIPCPPSCCLQDRQPASETSRIRPTPPICEATSHPTIQKAIQALQPHFHAIDLQTLYHHRRIQRALYKERIGQHHFASPDGYAHGDLGREALDRVYARLFGCEAALVRIQFLSGTHAIASVLYGVLRPGDVMMAVAGRVYDTLEEVIGIREGARDVGSLKDFGVEYREVGLLEGGGVDFEGIERGVCGRTRVAFIQRSFGYGWRGVLRNADIAEIVRRVKGVNADCVCFVDNCYGELTEEVEPVDESVGADVMAGSLIKNLGGGIAPSGGYVAGKREWVERARARLGAPGVGGGATLGMNRTLFQGLVLSAGMIGEALKGSLLVGEVMGELGYETKPGRGQVGFVRAVKVGSGDKVVEFCKAVQKHGAVGSFIEPVVGASEGYAGEVVFAQGTFVDGSTMEMSADGPLREPYVVFAQGGLHWTQWVAVLEEFVQWEG